MIDRVARWIAWKLPRRVVMWAAYRVGAHATQGRYATQIVLDLLYLDAMNRWLEHAGLRLIRDRARPGDSPVREP
jgi:hypothetical protein